MGKFFTDSGNQAVGEAFFAKVVEIWYWYLKNYFELGPEEQETFLIEQLSLEEAINFLTFIESTVRAITEHFEEAYDEEQASIIFTPVMHTYYAIGLLYKIFGDDAQCESYLKQVYRRCLRHLPQEHKKTHEIKEILLSMNVNLADAEREPELGQGPISGRSHPEN
jgi:hypothetical protein